MRGCTGCGESPEHNRKGWNIDGYCTQTQQPVDLSNRTFGNLFPSYASPAWHMRIVLERDESSAAAPVLYGWKIYYLCIID